MEILPEVFRIIESYHISSCKESISTFKSNTLLLTPLPNNKLYCQECCLDFP